MRARAQRQQRQPRQKRAKRSALASPEPISQTFMQHIKELRKRLFWTALIGLGIGTIVTVYYDVILHVVLAPYGNQKLIYLTVGGGFSFIFSVILYVALIGLMPIFLYQVYAFLRPAIPRAAQISSIKIAILAVILMAGGVSFGYFVAIPRGLAFLTTFASDVVESTLTAESYLNFVFGYAFGLGLLFELPLILMLWHWISPLSMKKLLMTERYIILVAFILAAIISPTPDALNQAMIAVPIIVIYQLGVIIVWLSIRKKVRAARKAAKQAAKTQPPADTPPTPPTVPTPPQTIPTLTARPRVAALASTSTRPVSAVSIDGFRRQKASSGPAKPSAQFTAAHTPSQKRFMSDVAHNTTAKQPSIHRGQIMVPSRNPRLISDFGPIHHSAIDTGR